MFELKGTLKKAMPSFKNAPSPRIRKVNKSEKKNGLWTIAFLDELLLVLAKLIPKRPGVNPFRFYPIG